MRIAAVAEAVNTLFLGLPQPQHQAKAIAHAACVSQWCGLLARTRGVDMEVCVAAGLLHDIWLYQHFPWTQEVLAAHGPEGAAAARVLLDELHNDAGMTLFSRQEIDVICQAIALHDATDTQHDPVDEVLKDADALANNGLRDVVENVRAARVLAAMGME